MPDAKIPTRSPISMKIRYSLVNASLALLLVTLFTDAARAQFTFSTNNDTLTLTRYTGTNGSVVVPDSTNGYSVTGIAETAFYLATMTNLTIGKNVAYIGSFAFMSCGNLTDVVFGSNVTVIANNAFDNCFSLRGVMLPSGLTNISNSVFANCKSLTQVNIPDGITSIGSEAFYYCTALTSATIGIGVTNIGSSAFYGCNNLTNVYFKGNAPTIGATLFSGAGATVYYLPKKSGWSSSFGGQLTILWNPQAEDGSFGVLGNGFGFNIVGSSNLIIVVETCSDLRSPAWLPITTNRLDTFVDTNGASYFSDPQWTNHSAGYYRFRSP